MARFFQLDRSRDHYISLLSEFARNAIHFKALDLDVESKPDVLLATSGLSEK